MKIAVLMSGGVDSSFVALHLKKKGYSPFGVSFLETGDKIENREILRAKKVANNLSIPHIILDMKNIYEEEIIQPFCQSLLRGETPNACPFCNRIIKLGAVFKEIKKRRIKGVATGHYVRRGYNRSIKRWFLKKAKDGTKDQSYFLWRLAQKQIAKTIFPLGDFTKNEVKARMQKRFPKLFSVSEYRESQDICFLRELKLSDFLKQRLQEKPGPILDLKGNIIGKHSGLHFFTIGQRTGLKIGARSPTQEPLYVTEIQKKKNAIIVGEERSLFKKEFTARDLNWVSVKPKEKTLETMTQIRYRHKGSKAKIHLMSQRRAEVLFYKPQRAITPGQHVVFYKKDLLLGGGIIDEVK